MEITIKIERLDEILNALSGLRLAADSAQVGQVLTQPVPAAPIPPVTQPVAPSVAVPTTQPEVTPAAIPAPQVEGSPAPAPAPVPTTAPSYTQNDLAVAAMTLMDKGMQAQLQELLSQFGVNSLPELPSERFGEFATALRGLGAQI